MRVIFSQSEATDRSKRRFLRKSFEMNILHKNRVLFSPGESDRIQPIWLRFTLTRRRVRAIFLRIPLRLCTLAALRLIRPQKIKVNQGVFETFLFCRKSRLIKAFQAISA